MTWSRVLITSLGLSMPLAFACGTDHKQGVGDDSEGNTPGGEAGQGGEGGASSGDAGANGTAGDDGTQGGTAGETGGGEEGGSGGGDGSCDEGETRCDGNTVEECNGEGYFTPREDCDGLCVDGECVTGEGGSAGSDGGGDAGSDSGTGGGNTGGGPGGGGGGRDGSGGGNPGGGDAGSPGGDPDCTLANVVELTDQVFEEEDNDHEVDLPATDEGDLLIVAISTDGRASVTAPAEWTELYTRSVPFDVNDGLTGSAYAMVAEDSGAPSANFVTGFEEQAAAQVFRISADSWSGSLAGVRSAATDHDGSTGNSTDPPELDISGDGWGDVPVLWIAVGHTGCCAGGTAVLDGPGIPAGFGNDLYSESGFGVETAPDVPQWAQITTARQALAAESQDPDPFTGYGSNGSSSRGSTFRVAGTIAVRPSCP